MKRKCMIGCLVFYSVCGLLSAHNDLLRGLDSYSRSDWNHAITSFKSALTSMPSEQKEVLYWMVMTQASAQNYRDALEYADRFLQEYPADERTAEVLYQQGRIFHLCGNYDKSSEILHRFIKNYPDHPKQPSAYYWIGENLYELGSYAEAREIFVNIVVNYPASGKVHEARYKIVMIDQQAVQAEMLEMFNNSYCAEQSEHEASDSELPEPPVSDTTAQPQTAAADEPEVSGSLQNDSSLVSAERQLDEERKQYEELYNRIITLETKIDALSAMLSEAASEKETRTIQEAQEKEREIQQQEQLKQQEIAKRKKELKDLQQRARTLERIYEQRMKGGQ